MRTPTLLVLVSVPPLMVLGCTSDLPAPDNYQESGFSASATDTAGGDIAIDCSEIPDGALLAQYDFTPTADGGEGALSWSQEGLPDGLSIDQVTGQITGVPEVEGPVSVTLSVMDGEDAMGTQTCEFEVHAALDVDLGLLLQAPPFCVRPGDTLLDQVIEGTGDGSPILCDTPGGSGNGAVPEGITVGEESCEIEGTLTADDRYGTYVWMVRGTQSGRSVWVPYCVTQDQQEADAYDIQIDHSGLPAMSVDSTLVPIVRTFQPDQPFAVGTESGEEPEGGEPQFIITDPASCGANACFFGFAFSINASPFDTSDTNFGLVTNATLLSDGGGNPIGFDHQLFIDGPGPQIMDFAEQFGDRPWVVNFGLDYCISDMDGPCDGGPNVRENGNGTIQQAILMFPE